MAMILKSVAGSRWTSLTHVLEIGASKFQLEKLSGPEYVGQCRYSVVDVRSLSHHKNMPDQFRFIQTGAESLPFEDQEIDVVLCNYVLQDAPDFQSVLEEIYRCLSNDGWAMLNVGFFGPRTRPVSQVRLEEPSLPEDYFETNGKQFLFGEDFLEIVADKGFLARLLKPQRKVPDNTLKFHGLKPEQEIILVAKSNEVLQRISQLLLSATAPLMNFDQESFLLGRRES